MRPTIFKIIRYTGLPDFKRFFVQRNKLTIILYHEISSTTAEIQFTYLKKYYNLLSSQTFYNAIENNNNNNKGLLPKNSLIITFDDGRIRNYKLLPIIHKPKNSRNNFL